METSGLRRFERVQIRGMVRSWKGLVWAWQKGEEPTAGQRKKEDESQRLAWRWRLGSVRSGAA